MNRADRRRAARRKTKTCDFEVAYTDFDGTRASMPCGHTATKVITTGGIDFGGKGGRYVTRSHVCAKHALEIEPIAQMRSFGVEFQFISRGA